MWGKIGVNCVEKQIKGLECDPKSAARHILVFTPSRFLPRGSIIPVVAQRRQLNSFMAMNTTHLDSSRPVISIPEPNPHTPLLPFISDAHLLLLLPTGAYWAYGLLFHWIDQRGYLARYKLHTPAEILKRNKVPMSKVIFSILFYQVTTIFLGFWMLRGSEPDPQGHEDRDIALWSLWLSQIRKFSSLSGWAIWGDTTIDSRFPAYSDIETKTGDIVTISALGLIAAKTMYYLLVPLAQFALAVFIADTWQYFTHRIVHTNQYLYSESYQSFDILQSRKCGRKYFEKC